MILTGNEIERQFNLGNISLYPFLKSNLNPNSYNYRIDNKIKIFTHLSNSKPVFVELEIPEEGYILEPGKMYLANTLETIGSNKYAMSLIGKSSMGRLGLFLQVSANLGHTNSKHKWTLELVASKTIRIYKNMIIGQVSFWKNTGDIPDYVGFYGKQDNIQESNL